MASGIIPAASLFAAPAPAPVPAPARQLKRRRHTPSSAVCVHCRKNKLGCDKTKPCRRCVLQNRAKSCVSWREVKAARTDEVDEPRAEPSAVPHVSAADQDQASCAMSITGSGSRSAAGHCLPWGAARPDSGNGNVGELVAAASTGLQTLHRMSFMTYCPSVQGQESDTTLEWSDDEDDDFGQNLRFLKALPLPASFSIEVPVHMQASWYDGV